MQKVQECVWHGLINLLFLLWVLVPTCLSKCEHPTTPGTEFQSFKTSHIFGLSTETLSFNFIRCSTELMVRMSLEVTSGTGLDQEAMVPTVFRAASCCWLWLSVRFALNPGFRTQCLGKLACPGFQRYIPAHESLSLRPLGRQGALGKEHHFPSTATGGKPQSFGYGGVDTKSAVGVQGARGTPPEVWSFLCPQQMLMDMQQLRYGESAWDQGALRRF